MYGDTQQMRRYAAALREQGTDVRLLADQLVSRTEAIGWVGRAADSMRERVRDRASHLRAAAARTRPPRSPSNVTSPRSTG